jgi:hypothetical protein
MTQIMTQLLFLILGILISIIGYFVKHAFDRLDMLEKDLESMKINCSSCNSKISDDIIDRVSKIIDEKLENWWIKIENGLMNEGRIPPRGNKKNFG